MLPRSYVKFTFSLPSYQRNENVHRKETKSPVSFFQNREIREMNYSNIVGYKFFAADHARILRGTDAQVGLPFGGRGEISWTFDSIKRAVPLKLVNGSGFAISLSLSLCALRPSPRPSHPINSPHLSPRPPVPPSTPSHVPLSRPVSGCLDPPLGCYYIYLYIYIHVYTYSNLIKGVKAEISSELVSSKLVEFLATLGRKNPLFPFFSPFLASFVVFFWLGGERGERSRSNFRGE